MTTPLNAEDRTDDGSLPGFDDVTVDLLRLVRDGRQAVTLTWHGNGRVILDVQTANAMLLVYDTLSGPNKDKFATLIQTPSGFGKMAAFCWSRVN